MLPKWPNDGSSHSVQAEPEKQKPRSCRTQELANKRQKENVQIHFAKSLNGEAQRNVDF
jgi:hypothetical protein